MLAESKGSCACSSLSLNSHVLLMPSLVTSKQLFIELSLSYLPCSPDSSWGHIPTGQDGSPGVARRVERENRAEVEKVIKLFSSLMQHYFIYRNFV
jgi:hypothetical protein